MPPGQSSFFCSLFLFSLHHWRSRWRTIYSMLLVFSFPFKTDNYFTWSLKIELILRSKGVWCIVSGKQLRPKSEGESRTWAARCDAAITCILLSFHKSCVAPVMKMWDPCEIWNKLKSNFEMVSQQASTLSWNVICKLVSTHLGVF